MKGVTHDQEQQHLGSPHGCQLRPPACRLAGVPMTARQEQIADLLFLRLCPLKRLYAQRLERMMAEDADSFDEAEYEEEAAKLIRLDRLMQRLSARLPASELLAA